MESCLRLGRNSVWREGVKLCERAIANDEIVVEKVAADEPATNIALPLRHEDRTVGALLIRTSQEFDDDDRALLLAVGGQMARNLQRELVAKGRSRPVGFFSVAASRKRLDSLYVLNGALLEQRVGINSLSSDWRRCCPGLPGRTHSIRQRDDVPVRRYEGSGYRPTQYF